jgi:hypothetical protein
MGFFRAITNGFINFFGITQPTPEQERRAAWFICSLLVLTVLTAAAVFSLLVVAFGHGTGSR